MFNGCKRMIRLFIHTITKLSDALNVDDEYTFPQISMISPPSFFFIVFFFRNFLSTTTRRMTGIIFNCEENKNRQDIACKQNHKNIQYRQFWDFSFLLKSYSFICLPYNKKNSSWVILFAFSSNSSQRSHRKRIMIALPINCAMKRILSLIGA